jgi:Mn2+/Fe2+ NRAMP family transporter
MGHTFNLRKKSNFSGLWKRLLVLLSVFGPATITAMADNDAGGVATYSIAGAKLGYPILFLLPVITLLLAITQEMGMRLTVITRRGLADLIREKYGVRAATLMFLALLIANIGTLVTEISAVKTTSAMFPLVHFHPPRQLQTDPEHHAGGQPVLPDVHLFSHQSPA